MTKGPAVVTKRHTVAAPPIFGRSSSWLRSQVLPLTMMEKLRLLKGSCDVQQDPVGPHKAWVGDFLLSKPASGLNSATLLPQKTFARGGGGA